ncbi:MAG: hypothetical protein IJY84_03455 [Clostridia bacterium]|nr:hypothetical protein [Clostridia bacterium]
MYICYHHANRTDRGAVTSCSRCRKGLCAECADKFRSNTSGRILCVDCYNAELTQLQAKADVLSKKNSKSYKTKVAVAVILGLIPVFLGIIGTVVGLFEMLGGGTLDNLYIGLALLAIGIWGSTILASFSKLIRNAKSVPIKVEDFFYDKVFKSEGCLSSVFNYFVWWIYIPIWLLSFVVGYVGVFILSPILFFFEMKTLKNDADLFKEFAEFQEYVKEENKIFFRKARAMTMQPKVAPTAEQINYVKGLLAQIENLKGQIVEAGKDKAKVSQLQSQINALNNQVESQNVEIEDLKGANIAMNKKFDDISGQMEMFKEKFDRINNRDNQPTRRSKRGK